MFDQTWTWAGRYRRTDKNIGVSASQVCIALRELHRASRLRAALMMIIILIDASALQAP
jgi:fido (protein-threonine AMPylation protein)